MISNEERQIWRDAFDLHEKYRDQLETPEKWTEFSEAVRDMVNGHGMSTMAFHIGVFLIDFLSEEYKDGHRPEPVQQSFFGEEAYT